jgi:hypothetical protein
VYAQAKKNGFHEGELNVHREDGEISLPGVGLKLALIHEEVSEALGELRSSPDKLKTYWTVEDVDEGDVWPVVRHEMLHMLSEGELTQMARALSNYVGVEDEVEPTVEGVGAALYKLKPEGLVVELADAVIRCMDLCGALGLDLEEAIRAKHEYNLSRPYRHGKHA